MTTTNFVVKNGITVGTASITASSGNANVGNLGFGSGQITGTGNITAGNANVTGQLISTVTTGTAPFVVTSTTQVANLNVATAGTATTAGTVTTNAQPNITSVGTLSSLAVTGNLSAGNIVGTTIVNTTGTITTTGNVSAGYVLGNGSQLTSITAASATTAGTVTTAAQPNITSVGTLTGLTVSGATSLTSTAAGTLQIGGYTQISGAASEVGIKFSGGGLTFGLAMQPITDGTTFMTFFNAANTSVGSITQTASNVTWNGLVTGGNVTGQVPNALVAGTVYTNAQPNITSVGTLTSLTVNGLGIFYNTLAAQNSPSVNSQGAWIGWNQSGGTGETNFINQQGGGAGGFNWQSSTILNARTTLATLTAAGTFTAANIISTSHVVHSVATGISAAGSTQGTATALITDFNVVSTVISGANGVALPTALAGYRITVFNTSANALNVYPLGNGIINSAAANVAFSLPAGDRLDFLCTTTATAPGGQWYTLNATYG